MIYFRIFYASQWYTFKNNGKITLIILKFSVVFGKQLNYCGHHNSYFYMVIPMVIEVRKIGAVVEIIVIVIVQVIAIVVAWGVGVGKEGTGRKMRRKKE